MCHAGGTLILSKLERNHSGVCSDTKHFIVPYRNILCKQALYNIVSVQLPDRHIGAIA